MALHSRMTEVGSYKQYDSRPCWKILLRLCFSHVGLLILVGLVAIFGAEYFIDVEITAEEKRYEVKRIKALDIQDSIDYLANYFYHYHGNLNGTESENHAKFVKKFKSEIGIFEEFVIECVHDYKYDGTVDEWEYDWTFSKALLFTISIMTTIGYGHISPKTMKGKISCIVYFILSAPLLLVFLANIGDSMAGSVRHIYSRFCCRPCRNRRKRSELLPGGSLKCNRVIDEVVGEEEYMPTNYVEVPIVLNLVIILAYLTVGALLFCYWEDWDYGTSSYFTFITLSTVGFGDYVPGKSFLNYEKDSFSSTLAIIINVMYCLLGMALLSMCINLMQEQIMNKCRWLAKEVGLTEGDDEDRPIPVHILREEAIKAQRKKRILETPKDKTGNKAILKKPKTPIYSDYE